MGNVDPSLCTGTPPPLPGGPGYKGVMETGCRQILGTSDSQPGEKDVMGRAALVGPSNRRLEVGHVPPNHGKSELEPLVKCWARDVFTGKSWSCLRHPRKAQTGHQCLRVNLEDPFHHTTCEPGMIPGHRLRPRRDFFLPAVWVKGDADSPWRSTSHPGLETTAVLSCGSLCQQLPLHLIQTPFPIPRRCPSGQEDC